MTKQQREEKQNTSLKSWIEDRHGNVNMQFSRETCQKRTMNFITRDCRCVLPISKIYVVRPQFFIPIITWLRNAALNSLQYKRVVMRDQHIDITHFERP